MIKKPWRNCPDCRGTGWRPGRPLTRLLEDGEVKEYKGAVERCPCSILPDPAPPASGPPKVDGQSRAAGE